jgi:hypothetical protein
LASKKLITPQKKSSVAKGRSRQILTRFGFQGFVNGDDSFLMDNAKFCSWPGLSLDGARLFFVWHQNESSKLYHFESQD